MSWTYKLCKHTTKEDKVVYTIREAYMNEEGGIWGVTEDMVNPIGWIEDEEMDDDDDARERVIDCLIDVINDCLGDILDLDKIEYADNGFDLPEDLKRMLDGNKTLQ